MQLMFKLKNGGKEELTMAEAKELYNELHQIFGETPSPFTFPDTGIPKGPTWSKGREFYGPITGTGVGKKWPELFGDTSDYMYEVRMGAPSGSTDKQNA